MLKAIVSATRTPAVARQLELASYVLAALWLAGAFTLVPSFVGSLSLGGSERITMIFAAILIGALGVSVLSVLGELYGQHARDLGARAIFEALQRGEKPKPFSLYLRPFASTNVISRTLGLGLQSERIELEAQIERATRPIGRLVALGAPLEHIGAGRIRVGDDTWRDAINLLLKHAQLIVVLPSSRTGTLQELDMILKSELITRTVMIDPPNVGHSKNYNHSAEWSKIQVAFKSASFELPDDTRAGTLIFYGDQRKPLLREHLDIDADDRISRLFRRILRHNQRRSRR